MFRDSLKPTQTPEVLLIGALREGHRQQLRVAFGGIHANVRWLLNYRLGRLGTHYCRTRDPAVKRKLNGSAPSLRDFLRNGNFT